MKLALIGNCQLEIIGDLIKGTPFLNEGKVDAVFNTPTYKFKEKEDFINIYHLLEGFDKIFVQYHSERWGMFSTNSLAKYFDITILPTIESRVSTPQLAYYSGDLPDLMVYVDYRFLHLYLSGMSHEKAVLHYHDVAFSLDTQMGMLKSDAQKYKDLFHRGDVCFDYSDAYYSSLVGNFDCFSTLSHPDNKNLSFLLQAIYFTTFGINEDFDLQGNALLDNYRAPKIGSGSTSYYMMRDTGLSLAGKINYSFFDSQKREQLERALIDSTYYQSIFDKFKNIA